MILRYTLTKCLEKLHFVNGTFNAQTYQNILEDYLLPSIQKLHKN